MIYQVRVNFFFDIEDEARDFYHDAEVAFPKTMVVNPDSKNSEYSIAELIINRHDDDPNSPCSLLLSQTNKPPPPD